MPYPTQQQHLNKQTKRLIQKFVNNNNSHSTVVRYMTIINLLYICQCISIPQGQGNLPVSDRLIFISLLTPYGGSVPPCGALMRPLPLR